MGARARAALAAVWLIAAAAGGVAAMLAGREVELSNYGTSLAGRTEHQRHNAVRAAAAIDGTVVGPGEEFSFNTVVGPWTRDRGYRRAPVSFGGEIVIAYGGGVCQTSSTLYNAALLAGLTIIERDHHVWEPGYVAAGRDAAVAQGIADLRFQNPYRWPIALHAGAEGQQLVVRVTAPRRPADTFHVEVEPLASEAAAPVVRLVRDTAAGRGPQMRPGRPGRTVRCVRLRYRDGRLIDREILSHDTYQALSPVIGVGAAR